MDTHTSNSQTQQDSNTNQVEDAEFEEYVEDVAAEVDIEQPVNPRKRKSTKTSPYWAYFEPITVEIGEPPIKKQKGKCKICGTLIAADPKLNDTMTLKNHSEKCNEKHAARNNQSVLNLQSIPNGKGILTSWKFDQLACRIALCEMIILDELPFRFVEREGFRRFVERLCPQFKIPSRFTIRADCVKMFLEKKITMKSFFERKGMGRVLITTDCWTSINNTNFICVTAHCIDKDWLLHKKIITFSKICSHKGDDLGASIISSLEEWGLQKVLCCTMDNATSNDICIRHMKQVIERWNTSVVGGKFLHVRCVAHILNLVVHDGLEEIGLSVRRVQEAVKWIKASPSRSDSFNNTVNALKIDSSKSLCLDVPTRWNSTYLMLESALPYEEAIKFFGRIKEDFVLDLQAKTYKDQPIGVPADEDWVNVKRMIDYLEKFYDMTLLVSGTSYVTSHHFFKEMCAVFELIQYLEDGEDEEIKKMASKMKTKLGKYWLEDTKLNPMMNKILYIAALLDPRQKMKHVEMCLQTVYGEERATDLVAEVNKSLHELFEFYKKEMTPTSTPRVNTSVGPIVGRMDRRLPRPRGKGTRCTTLHVVSDEQPHAFSDPSEITLYFTEKQHVMTPEEVDTFDILDWWKKHGPRFPVLSEMARDILAIPISSVASEFAFSTGGRILSQFRSSLTPNMVEALIYAEDWLKSSPVDAFLKDEEDVPETELEKEFETVLNTFGFNGEREGQSRTTVSAQTSQSAA